MKKEIHFDKETLKEMILYISEKCENELRFSKTHLFKILHYSDFLWFGHTGNPISGETYFRWEHGQVPRHFEDVSKELINDGLLKIVEKPYFDRIQRRTTVLKKPKFKKLSKEQQDFIDTIIDKLTNYDATYVSKEISHNDLSWKYLSNNDDIPYETVFFRRKVKPSEETLAWAKKEIDEYEKSR